MKSLTMQTPRGPSPASRGASPSVSPDVSRPGSPYGERYSSTVSSSSSLMMAEAGLHMSLHSIPSISSIADGSISRQDVTMAAGPSQPRPASPRVLRRSEASCGTPEQPPQMAAEAAPAHDDPWRALHAIFAEANPHVKSLDVGAADIDRLLAQGWSEARLTRFLTWMYENDGSPQFIMEPEVQERLYRGLFDGRYEKALDKLLVLTHEDWLTRMAFTSAGQRRRDMIPPYQEPRQVDGEPPEWWPLFLARADCNGAAPKFIYVEYLMPAPWDPIHETRVFYGPEGQLRKSTQLQPPWALGISTIIYLDTEDGQMLIDVEAASDHVVVQPTSCHLPETGSASMGRPPLGSAASDELMLAPTLAREGSDLQAPRNEIFISRDDLHFVDYVPKRMSRPFRTGGTTMYPPEHRNRFRMLDGTKVKLTMLPVADKTLFVHEVRAQIDATTPASMLAALLDP